MTLRASEQDRPDIARARKAWRRQQLGFDPARLVFIDESNAKTNMTRLRGRTLRGKRLYASTPQSHWHTTTMICSMRWDGSTACMTIEAATDTEVFRVYVRQVLCPTLRPGDVVIMDNLSPHKSVETLSLIQQLGAEVLFLPAYSPDLNPIKRCGANSKNFYAAPKPVPGRASSRRLPRLWRPSQPKTSSIGLSHAAIVLFN